MEDAIRYKGNAGSLVNNDFGSWETGQVREVGNTPGQVSPNAAAQYVAHGCFEWVEASPAEAPASKAKKSAKDPE